MLDVESVGDSIALTRGEKMTTNFMTEESFSLARAALLTDPFYDEDDPHNPFHREVYALATIIGELLYNVGHLTLQKAINGPPHPDTYVVKSGKLALSEKGTAREAFEQAYRDFAPGQALSASFAA